MPRKRFAALRCLSIALAFVSAVAQLDTQEEAQLRGSSQFLAGALPAHLKDDDAQLKDADDVGASPAPVPLPVATAPAPAPAAVDGMSASSEVVFTMLASAAQAGATVIAVASTEGFDIGSSIVIGGDAAVGVGPPASGGTSETRTIIGFGAINNAVPSSEALLDSPLQHSYPARTVVQLAVGEAALSSPAVTTLNATAALSDSDDPGITVVAETEKKMDELVAAEREVMDPADPLNVLKEELAATTWLRDELEDLKNSLKEEVYRGKIATAEEQLAKEASPGTAKMLGDMRREMHQLAAPFFSKVLEDNLSELTQREKELLAEIEGKNASGATSSKVASKLSSEEELSDDVEEEATLDAGGKASSDGAFGKGVVPEALAPSKDHIEWVAVYLVFLTIFMLFILGGIAICSAVRMWRSGTHPSPRLM